MANCAPNPDLWLVKARPRQPLKEVFYANRFLSHNLVLLAVVLKHLPLANCIISI